MKKIISNHRLLLTLISAIVMVCFLFIFYKEKSTERILNLQNTPQPINQKNISNNSFSVKNNNDEIIFKKIPMDQDANINKYNEDDVFENIYAMFSNGDALKAVRELEFKISDAKTNEVDGIQIAEDLASIANNDSRISWISMQLENKIRQYNPEKSDADIFSVSCSIISRSINPVKNSDISISHSFTCFNQQPKNQSLAYDYALALANAEKINESIEFLKNLPAKNDENILLLVQNHQRSGKIQEAIEYADLLRSRNSPYSKDVQDIPSNI